jgi:Tol biopolymer transport system component
VATTIPNPAAGDELGPYRLLTPIGKGGMGEVWRALDTRLDRQVAVKISKAEFTARFLREARMVASLNHPNICQLYDVAHNYLVMEVIDGESPRGPVAEAKIVEWSCQVLDALGAAHRRGIVHLDLKPANVLATGHGLKLLDFGLARRAEPMGVLGDEEATYLGQTRDTEFSGTPGYMSPEQLQGKPLDGRSDIFSFGCMMYEWATGQRAFPGDNMASIVAAVLEREPPPTKLRPALERVLRACLEKNPEERFQTVRDVKRALLWAVEAPLRDGKETVGKGRSRVLPWALAGVLLVAAAAAGWGWRREAVRERSVPMLELTVAAGQEVMQPVLSPDGSRIAFVSRGQLALRSLDEAQIRLIPGTNDATYPFFSPDGKWLGYFSNGKMRKVAVDGGVPLALCDAPGPRGASWGEDGVIIAALNLRGGLMKIPDGGGTPTVLIDPLDPKMNGEGYNSFRSPWIIPGRRGMLFVAMAASTSRSVLSYLPEAGGAPKALVENASGGRYMEGGYLVFYRDGKIYASKMDLAHPERLGAPVKIAEDAAYDIVHGAAFDVSWAGTMVFTKGPAASEVMVSRLSGDGRFSPVIEGAGAYLTPRISPDGKKLALLIENEGQRDLWIRDLGTGEMKRLTFDSESHNYPVWTPNGEFIMMEAGDPGTLAWVRADGTGKEERIEPVAGYPFPASFSPDGKVVALWVDTPMTLRDIWTAPVEEVGDGLNVGRPEPFLQMPGSQLSPRFSPDGRWLAYGSDESGRSEIYVTSYAGKGGGKRWKVSVDGGLWPVWSRRGDAIYYRTEAGDVMVTGVSGLGDLFSVGSTRRLSERRLSTSAVNANFDVAADGSVIGLFPKQAEPVATEIEVRLNVRDGILQAPRVDR